MTTQWVLNISDLYIETSRVVVMVRVLKIVIVIGILCVLGNFPAHSENLTEVYFIPFQVETYTGITQENIINHAWEKWTISSEPETSYLGTLLTQGNATKFDDSVVRAMVLIKGSIYLIDASGSI